MPMRPQTTQQNGTQHTGQPQDPSPRTQPDPTQRDTVMAAWLDEVITAGGVTADATDVIRLQTAADHLAEVTAANGTELAPEQEKPLSALARDLRRVAQNGDRTLTNANADSTTLLGQSEYRLQEFLDAQGDSLSDAAKTLLTGALSTIETVYADGVVSTEERTSVAGAADAVCSVLKDDFVKLSTTGLAALQGQSDDLTQLIGGGFLSLDTDQLAAVTTADTALHALLSGGGDTERTAVHEAMAGLQEVLMGAIIDLANPAGELLGRGQNGGNGSGNLFIV